MVGACSMVGMWARMPCRGVFASGVSNPRLGFLGVGGVFRWADGRRTGGEVFGVLMGLFFGGRWLALVGCLMVAGRGCFGIGQSASRGVSDGRREGVFWYWAVGFEGVSDGRREGVFWVLWGAFWEVFGVRREGVFFWCLGGCLMGGGV